MDKRAEELHHTYVKKARDADINYGGAIPGQQGRVERKVLSFPAVEGIVFGNWGEASEATHNLVDHMATSRARIAEPQTRKRGAKRLTEEGIKSMAVGFIRQRLSVAGVKSQCMSLTGRVESMGPGAKSAANRRSGAIEQEEQWRRERAAHVVASRQGYRALRRGFAKLD